MIVDDHEGLVRAAARGDRESFGVLVEGCWERLVRLARSIVGDLEAEDAVQDALLTAWKKLSQLGDPGKFDSWVTKITFRRCVRRFGRWRWRLRRDSEQQPPSQAAGPAEGDLEVWSVLRHLPPRQRAVLHLTVVEGMTDSEIAIALGLRAGSVRAHRRRARQRLTRLLGSRSTLREGGSDVGQV